MNGNAVQVMIGMAPAYQPPSIKISRHPPNGQLPLSIKWPTHLHGGRENSKVSSLKSFILGRLAEHHEPGYEHRVER